MRMNLRDCEQYLTASRQNLDKCREILAKLGFCCPMAQLQNLIEEQEKLEDVVYLQKRNNGLGWIWLVTIATTAATYLGSRIYDHYTKSKQQTDYLSCLERVKADFIADGVDPSEAISRASQICTGNLNQSDSIARMIKLVVVGAIAVSGFFFGAKLLDRKKK